MEYLFCGRHTFLSGSLFLMPQNDSDSRLLELCHLRAAYDSSQGIKIWTFEIRYAEVFTPNTK